MRIEQDRGHSAVTLPIRIGVKVNNVAFDFDYPLPAPAQRPFGKRHRHNFGNRPASPGDYKSISVFLNLAEKPEAFRFEFADCKNRLFHNLEV